MNYSALAEYRTALLDLYDSLESLCEDFSESGYEVDSVLKDIQKNVAEEKFLLAIFGEVKAGKSTFINALLKEEILPSDVLQATSEIIEVHKSDKKEVKVTFANYREQVVEDSPQTPEDEVALFLKDIASVNEKYRGIPIVQVNKFLIEHYSKRKEKAVLEEKELEAFLSSDLENIHNLDEEEFRRKIREYIEKNISCDKIPLMVSLYYPHDFSELKHFRIVDTPGVNATGGLEDRTKEFINEANGVICLHKVPPLESKSLRDVLEDKLLERVKDRLILVLTHRSRQDENENERILNEAERLYSEIGSSNIFFVDSLTELHLPKFYEVETMDEIKDIFIEDQKLQQLTASCYVEADNPYKFLSLLEKQANFGRIRERIEKDAQKSASDQMKEFASNMGKNYKDLGDRIIEYIIEPRKSKYKDPQFFASKIQDQKKKIEKMENDYNKSISSLKERFSHCNVNSEYYKEIDQIGNDVNDEIDGREFASEQDINSYVGRLCQDRSDKVNSSVDSLKKKFVDSLRSDARGIIGRDIEVKNRITAPRIPVNKVWEKALNAADIEINRQLEEASKGFLSIFAWRKKRRIRESRPQQVWQEIQPLLKKQLERNETLLHRKIEHFIDKCCDGEYKLKFDEALREQEHALKKLQEKEKSNEELGGEISRFEKEKENIGDKIQICQRIGGNL